MKTLGPCDLIEPQTGDQERCLRYSRTSATLRVATASKEPKDAPSAMPKIRHPQEAGGEFVQATNPGGPVQRGTPDPHNPVMWIQSRPTSANTTADATMISFRPVRPAHKRFTY